MRTFGKTTRRPSIKTVINWACLIFPLKVTVLPWEVVVLRTHPEAEDVDLDGFGVVGELEERDHLVLLRPPSASAPVRQPSPSLHSWNRWRSGICHQRSGTHSMCHKHTETETGLIRRIFALQWGMSKRRRVCRKSIIWPQLILTSLLMWAHSCRTLFDHLTTLTNNTLHFYSLGSVWWWWKKLLRRCNWSSASV